MKNKNSLIITIIVAIIVGAAAFYGGMQYQKSQRASFVGNQTLFRNGEGGNFKGRFGNGNNRPVIGEIINQDDNSITVKMQDGSSKIVILSDQTMINKASTGTKGDLKTGERVTAFGTTNADGSVTARNVSVGGAMMFRGGPGTGREQPQSTPQP
jgi:hypothetical protein